MPPRPPHRTKHGKLVPIRRPAELTEVLRDSAKAARRSGLVHVSSEDLGIRRIRRGRGFRYLDARGKPVTDRRTLERIASLAIPPAWTDVRISTHAAGHLQCTGSDARGRRQYRYHPSFRKLRDEAKYQDILEFAAELPRLRRAIERDLAASALTKDKVVATILAIMDRTALRVGNDRYAKENGSFGLTTLEGSHARVVGPKIAFSFRGKGGKAYRASVRDKKLAAIVKRCRDMPGQRLFQYEGVKGRHHAVTSTDVNAYIRRITGRPFSAKEFRTWSATVHAAVFLHEAVPGSTATARKKSLLAALDRVADHLGNTRAICKNCYVHPLVVSAFETGRLGDSWTRCLSGARARAGFGREECAVLALLGELTRPRVRLAA